MSYRALVIGAIAVALAGCESGEIAISPSTNVTDSNNTNITGGGGTTNPCAAYTNSGGQQIQGVYDGTNCTYSPTFVDSGNNISVDMTIPALDNDGAHIFQGSLFVGENYESNAELLAAGIVEGGDGPRLTIEAGATLAFVSEEQFITINRGSQLFAVGRADAPITFTSVSDINGTVQPEDVQQWGGIIINGFGVTNKCSYTGAVSTSDLALNGECHVLIEGTVGLDETHYGGGNNNDSSGRLEYVVVKHTGAEASPDSELNGISFGAVGRNTVIRNLETYATYDDGIELFGGAVNIENFVALYVRDDSVDLDEGWSGTITNALIIQAQNDGAHCIESDGIGDFSDLLPADVEAIIAQGINTRPTINNMTCIVSPNGIGQHEPGAGWRFREGIFPTVNNTLLISSFAASDATSGNDNYCLRLDNRTQQAALDGDVSLNGVIISCGERTRGQSLAGGAETEESFAVSQGVVFATVPSGSALNATAAMDSGLQLLTGTPPIYSIAHTTSVVDDVVAPGAGPTTGTHLGALVEGGVDWTAGWTYGIHDGSRAQPLWFE